VVDPGSLGQRGEYRHAVARRCGSTVEQCDEAAVAAAADEPAEPLFETYRRSGNHVVLETVEAASLERAYARHHQGIVRRWKRQPVDDDAREGIADDVDPFPEGCGGKENRSRRLAKPLEQMRTR